MSKHQKIWSIMSKLIITFIALLFCGGFVNAIEYKDFKRQKKQDVLFEIQIDDEEIIVTTFLGETENESYIPKGELKRTDDYLKIGDNLTFHKNHIAIGSDEIAYRDISDIYIDGETDAFSIMFYKTKSSGNNSSRFRRGNLFQFDGPLVVEEDEFIRGFVLSITGDIEVYGEVNKEVISLLGEIYIGSDAVVRGDVSTIKSRIDVANDASLYGGVYSGKKQKSRRTHRFQRRDNDISTGFDMTYNKVDGLAIYSSLKYNDVDSTLPSLWAKGGYGFASDRWRYFFGFEQVLSTSLPIAVGGELYRRLASEDDHLLQDDENTAFAIFAAEDFKDYYEGEGGTAYLRVKPFGNLTLESRYRIEKTNFIESTRGLWAVFGRSKNFDKNFHSVEETFRLNSIAEIDTTDIATLSFKLDYKTTNDDFIFDNSAWHLKSKYEWSHPDLNSDFDYKRYSVSLTRFQKINRRAMLILSGAYGSSEGYLPMYKRFYLGGLGTLRGFHHKEFMGTEFWMGNAEYRVEFPRIDIATSIFWDIGKIANDESLSDAQEIRNNLGVGFYIGDDFKITLAKRLDSDPNDDPKVLVRLTHNF